MKPTIKQVKKVLMNNKELQEAYKYHEDVAKTLKHWAQYKSYEDFVDRIIFTNPDNGAVCISNEESININDGYDTYELLPTLDEDFKKAKIHVQWENAGAISTWEA